MVQKELSPDELSARYRRLDRIGRRCVEKHNMCTQTAIVDVTTYRIHPTTKERLDAEPEIRRLCARHRAQYERGGNYEHVSTAELPPRTDIKPPRR